MSGGSPILVQELSRELTEARETIARLEGSVERHKAALQAGQQIRIDNLERAERAEAEVALLREILEDARVTIKHARVFIQSREKMHPDGQILYDECLASVTAALKGETE